MDRKLLSEVKRDHEKVIAISLHHPERAGVKGYVKDYDDIYIEFEQEYDGKIVMLPIQAHNLKRVTKEQKGGRRRDH